MSTDSIKEITPMAAWEILKEEPGAVLIDVRSTMEFDYVGHPVGAVNIPWKDAPEWQINRHFVDQVREMLQSRQEIVDDIESLPLLLICRSGRRSHEAAEELMQHGFSNVCNVSEGFEGDRDGNRHRSSINGWRFRDLPWEQS